MVNWQMDELRWHWGDAYEISDQGGGWRARRRDGKGGWLTAPDANALEDLIRADYAREPVSRDAR